LGIASGTAPGQIGSCTWPGEGCQTAASACKWAHASTNKKITRIGLCMVSMEVAGFDLNIAVRSDSAEHDKRSFWQKKGTIRANCGIVLKVSEL
jgi:hypothetical protein